MGVCRETGRVEKTWILDSTVPSEIGDRRMAAQVTRSGSRAGHCPRHRRAVPRDSVAAPHCRDCQPWRSLCAARIVRPFHTAFSL